MSLFHSLREKRLWLCALLVIVLIFATLFIGQPLANQLRDQNVQAAFFLVSMLLMSIAVLVFALRIKPQRTEFMIWVSLAAIFIMFFFRLGAPERSHLIEYSSLSIFIYCALLQRPALKQRWFKRSLLAFTLTFGVGVLDECIQLLLPNRVFDFQDILFNGMITFMTLGSVLILTWIRQKLTKPAQ